MRGTRQQLEFRFNGRQACRRILPGQRRRSRRHWWFEQMRRAVESPMPADSCPRYFNGAGALRSDFGKVASRQPTRHDQEHYEYDI